MMSCFCTRRYASLPINHLHLLQQELPLPTYTLQQIGYRLNLKTKVCDKFTLKEPFPVIGVPPDAKFDGEGYIGASGLVGAGVLVDLFNADTERGELYCRLLCISIAVYSIDSRVESTLLSVAILINIIQQYYIPSPPSCRPLCWDLDRRGLLSCL